MKKKIVSYLILACSLIGMVTIGSCRDYDDYADLRALNKIDHQRFDDSLDSLRHDVDSIFELLKNMCTCTVNCDSLDSVVHVLDSATTKWLLKGMTGDSIKNILGLDSTFQDSNDVAGVLRYLNKRVNDVRHDLDSIADTLTNTDKILMRFDTIIKNRVDTLDSIVMQVLLPLRSYKDTIDSITPILRDLRKAVYDTIMPKMKALEQRMDTLEHRVDSLMDAEKKRITSLYVQGTVNPTFGSFALPIGIRSNILSCYYGKALTDVAFPAYGASLDAVLDPGMELQAAELAAIGANPTQTTLSANNTIISDSANNAGRIFITVNPNEVKIDSTYKFYLVNSLGDSTKVKMDTLKPSTEKLTFGLTRAGGNTGFYEAAVKIEESGLDTLSPKLAVSKEQLKNIAKDILSYKDGINLSGIAGAVFELAQTQLDANAVKVEWKDSLGQHSVTSGYDVAVAAIQPLSYQAGQGIGTSRRLPTINPLTDLSISVPSTIHIDLSSISFDVSGITSSISFGAINISYPTVTITVDVPAGTPGRQADGTKTYPVDGLNALIDDINNTFAGQTVTWASDVNTTINNMINNIKTKVDQLIQTQLGAKLDQEVNKMLTDVQTSINSSLSGFNSYFSKMNSLISRINSVTSRINSKLDLDVNAFLQPTIMYQGNDGTFHPMSNDPAYPSKFTAANGGIVLYPTSYTAELLAPAYKKYIAVVGGPAAGVAEANGLEYMNEVIDGNRFAVPFKVTTPGTYTIYYSAVDYSGVISAQRFYVTVE